MAGTGSGGLDMIQREYSRVLTQRTGSPQSLNGPQTSRTRLHGHHPVLPVREQAPSKRSCYPRRTRSGGNLAFANRGDAPGSEMTDLFFTAHVPTIGAKTAGRWWDRSEERRVGKECRCRWRRDHRTINKLRCSIAGSEKRGVESLN